MGASERAKGWRLRRGAAALLVALGVVACASPTIPLPPPQLPSVSASTTQGYVHLSSQSGAEPHAIIVIVNQNPAVPNDKRVGGAQADGFGSWDADVLASSGDLLEITETSGTLTSPSISVRVP